MNILMQKSHNLNPETRENMTELLLVSYIDLRAVTVSSSLHTDHMFPSFSDIMIYSLSLLSWHFVFD